MQTVEVIQQGNGLHSGTQNLSNAGIQGHFQNLGRRVGRCVSNLSLKHTVMSKITQYDYCAL